MTFLHFQCNSMRHGMKMIKQDIYSELKIRWNAQQHLNHHSSKVGEIAEWNDRYIFDINSPINHLGEKITGYILQEMQHSTKFYQSSSHLHTKSQYCGKALHGISSSWQKIWQNIYAVTETWHDAKTCHGGDFHKEVFPGIVRYLGNNSDFVSTTWHHFV